MISHQILIPEPSPKLLHEKIDLLALQFSQTFRSQCNNKNGFPFDADRFVDWIEISTEWDNLNEPDGAAVFAQIDSENNELIQINENHRELFEKRPDVHRGCIGHETGHIILRHFEHSSLNNDCPLFGIADSEKLVTLHKSSWGQYGLSGEEVKNRQAKLKKKRDKWVKEALINSKARQALHTVNDKFEPEWMFWQAEQFARCLCIPRDRLFEVLEEEPLFSGWRPISRLASIFGVSTGTMKTRLVKLKLIEIDSTGIPIPIAQPSLNLLFS